MMQFIIGFLIGGFAGFIGCALFTLTGDDGKPEVCRDGEPGDPDAEHN